MNLHELDDVAACALNALPADEARELESRLDPELAAELASYCRVSVALTEGLPDIVPAAPPELWDRIKAEAGITQPPPPIVGARRLRPGSLMLAAAAVVAVVAVGATSLLTIRDSAPDNRSLAAAAINDAEAFTATLTSPDGLEQVTPEVVITADGTGFVVADSLPRLADSRTYQLWLVVDDRVISAALLGNDPGVIQFRAEGNISGIAISNEPAGGVVVSEVSPTALWLSDSL